jgi:quercetin dioxygenase-like cupin family protein
MNTKPAWIAVICLLPLPLVAQTHDVITMDQEPHHHLALHNDYVKVFNVEVMPGDSIVLHSHDQDTIAIAIGEQLVTVGIPGKTIPPSKNADGQVRLQRAGYIHSTHVDGDTPYHTVAVELMQKQTSFHNLCAEILSGQPLNCPKVVIPIGASNVQPLLESDETRALLVRVLAHQSMKLGESPAAQVIVALDAASVSSGTAKGPEKALKPGDFVWMDAATSHASTYQNPGDKEARFIQIVFLGAK